MSHASSRALRLKAVTSFFWAYGAFIGGRVLVFVATLILARILVPEQFGLVAFALAILAYMENLTDLGVGAALIYRADALDPRIASTAFWIAITGSIVLMSVSWFAAPLLVHLIDDPDIVPMFRVISLQFLFTALGSTHQNLLRHSLDFKKSVFPEVTSGFLKGVISVALALGGLGAWSLIIGQLGGSLTRSALLWVVTSWRPSLLIAFQEVGSMVRYGGATAATSVLGEGTRNFDYVVVGARLGDAALGFYLLAFRLPELVLLAAFQVAWRVLFPFYSRLKDLSSAAEVGREQLLTGYLQSVRLGALVAFPAAGALAALASPLVLTLYGERWGASTLPLVFIAIWAGTYSVAGMPGTIFRALGRPGLMTMNAIVYLIALVPTLWVTASFGITGVAAGQASLQAAFLVYLGVLTGRVLACPWYATIRQAAPGMAIAVAVGASAYVVSRILPPALALITGLAVASVVYLALVRAFLPAEFARIQPFAASVRARRSRRRPQ